MKRGPKSLAAVLGLAAVSLLALALTGLMEWVSAVLFLLMEFLAEFLRPLLERRRPRRRMIPAPAPAPAPAAAHSAGPSGVHRALSTRRIRPRRPAPRPKGRGRIISPFEL